MSASSEYQDLLAKITLQKGAVAAEAIRQSAQARSAAAQANAQIWGGTLGNLGQYLAQIPAQQIQLQQAKQQAALNDIRLKEAQDQQRGQQQVDQLMQGDQLAPGAVGPRQDNYLTPDGLFDIPKMTQALAGRGVAHLAPDLLKGAESINDSILKHQTLEQQAAQQHAVLLGDLADGALKLTKAGTPLLDAMDFAVQPAIATKRIKPEEYAQVRQAIAAMPPEQQQAALSSLMDTAAKASPSKTLAKDAQEVDRYGRVMATNLVADKPKTKAELAADAANPNSPTATISKAALDLLETASGTSSGELKPVRVGGKMVFAIFDPKTKRLTYQGQDVTETAEPPRDPLEAQAASIAAQAAQQARAQGFTEKQAGRRELTDKVEQPYQTAQAGVDTLRETIQAAKDGNVVAGQLQSLLTTMATLKAEGFNRINTAEINATGDAGSMFQRIEGWFSHATAGQPIPASVQKDMATYADILEKAAYKKYQSGFQTTTKRYGLSDEQPLPPPQSVAPAAAAPKANPFRK